MSMSSVSINDQASVDYQNAQVNRPVSIAFRLGDQVSGRCSCPGCITQLMIGVAKFVNGNQTHKAEFEKCLTSGSMTTSYAGDYTMNFEPTSPGTYYVRIGAAREYSCADAMIRHDSCADAPFARIEVVA
jgi:hypothetical protein